jgi:hypothetical protein
MQYAWRAWARRGRFTLLPPYSVAWPLTGAVMPGCAAAGRASMIAASRMPRQPPLKAGTLVMSADCYSSLLLRLTPSSQLTPAQKYPSPFITWKMTPCILCAQ